MSNRQINTMKLFQVNSTKVAACNIEQAIEVYKTFNPKVSDITSASLLYNDVITINQIV